MIGNDCHENTHKTLKKALLLQENLSDLDLLKINYALEVLKNESIKTFLLFIFFFAIEQLPAFLLCMGILCTVRIFSGGIHFNSNSSCFISSLIFLCMEILILPILSFKEIWWNIGLIVSIIIICLLSPIPSYKRPIKSRKKYIYCKTLSIVFSVIWGIILAYFINDTHLANCGFWVLSIQAIELTIQKFYRFFKSHFKIQRKAGIFHV